jgi:serine/threonine protein kinase
MTFAFVRELGKGVNHAYNTKTGQQVALKFGASHSKQHLAAEAEMCARIKPSDNIITYYGVSTVENQCCLVFELMQTDLEQFLLNDFPTLSLCTKAYIGYQILCGLSALEAANMAHNDLQPRNVMVKYSGDPLTQTVHSVQVKIADFGIACLAGDRPKSMHPQFQYPEVAGPVSVQANMFQFGIMLFYLFRTNLGGKPRYPKHLVKYCAKDSYLENFYGIPKEIKTIMSFCLKANPVERPTCAELQTVFLELAKRFMTPVNTPVSMTKSLPVTRGYVDNVSVIKPS